MFITNTPVYDGVIKVWHGTMVKSPNAVATEQDVVDLDPRRDALELDRAERREAEFGTLTQLTPDVFRREHLSRLRAQRDAHKLTREQRIDPPESRKLLRRSDRALKILAVVGDFFLVASDA